MILILRNADMGVPQFTNLNDPEYGKGRNNIEEINITHALHVTPEMMERAELIIYAPEDSPVVKVLASRQGAGTGLLYPAKHQFFTMLVRLGPLARTNFAFSNMHDYHEWTITGGQ